MSTASCVPGVTSRFHVTYCSHDSMFETKYTRYQKAGKVKVLRYSRRLDGRSLTPSVVL
ncbi:hypothetical protein ACHHYP_20450 [Achlya hypogyna]|uniref:Uncharacterized protein n=1 Tax=Achlya hypogyna TaxID=1202772 RepID=A0A1V9YM28_ACHHY|nr:hypothetical protein ACHHYP_20450 [Achlya hypogyna]